ncbi:DUF2806 domain-containing protein [uncultured Fusobacterium sp.]|uniref:DUF2806 domain-containing protein n=1 Tax=uncultured Fusobacterium sp. TaxID=159267 RepID=UPI002593E0FC|nr:DUF2806 domain-containing protein [uncultured Fusobacterium sp.]
MKETIKALISPIEKLLDTVSRAIGKAYEPTNIRKIADAKAHEINVIADAMRNNVDIPIIYDSSKVTIDTGNYEEIAKRASTRLAYQEIIKQQNIENVVNNAYEELKESEKVSNEPVDPDWVLRFFNSVENISDEDMQKVWARILAGEIKTPNTYSYRTMEKLKNMTQKEVELFQKIAEISLYNGNIYFIFFETSLLSKYDLKFSDILLLEECGLISSQVLSLNFTINNKEEILYNNNKFCGSASNIKDENREISSEVYVFTESGMQLLRAISPKRESRYILDCLKDFTRRNKGINTKAHEITTIDSEGKITYLIDNILEKE